MRKLQTTGKTCSRAGTALYGVRKAQPGARISCSGTFVSLEFQLQQQSQATLFRPSAIKFREASFPGQKQRSKTSTRHCTGEHSCGENNSLCSIASRSLSSLRPRHSKNCSYRAPGESTNRSSRRNQVDSSGISPSCGSTNT